MNQELLDLYKLYFGDLKDLHEGYLSFEITMSVAILTAIGWFLTSEKASKFLLLHRNAGSVFTIVIIVTALSELFIVCKIKIMTDNIYTLLKEIAGQLSDPLKKVISTKFYNYRVIPTETICVLYCFHLVLLILLGLIIINSKNTKKGLINLD